MATFTWEPDYGMSADFQQSKTTLMFGDGYKQITSTNLNNINRVFNVSFTKVPSEIDAIEVFLNQHGDVNYFDWAPPDEDVGKFIVKDSEWERSIDNFGFHKITATFVEVFEV